MTGIRRPSNFSPAQESDLLEQGNRAVLHYENALRVLARDPSEENALRVEACRAEAQRVLDEISPHVSVGTAAAGALWSRFALIKDAHSVRPTLSDYSTQPKPTPAGEEGHSLER